MYDFRIEQRQAAFQQQRNSLGLQSNDQMQAAETTPRADTVRGLLDIAYKHIGELEQEIGRLGEQLMPVRELTPTKESDCGGTALGEPEVIGLLRGLIGRLARQQSIVRSIANETRI